MNPKELADLDQSMKILTDTFPPMLWGFYKGCLYQGFTKEEAFELTKVWLLETRKASS